MDSDYSVNFFWQELLKLLETKKLAINHQNFAAWRKKRKKERKLRTQKLEIIYIQAKKLLTLLLLISLLFFSEEEQQALYYTFCE
jgi:hypothetical protein